MSRIDPKLLSRYYDGELSSWEEEDLRARLEGDERAVALLASWDDLGASLCAWAESKAGHRADIAQAVVDRIHERPQLRLIAGGKADKIQPATPPVSEAARRRERFNLRWAAVGFFATAAAASLLLIQAAPSKERLPSASRAVVDVVSTAAAQVGLTVPERALEPVAADAEASIGSAIEAVEFGAHSGSIFMVSAGSTATPVVWLTDEPQGARVEPL